uniref:Uncharacterized protein n=1 Tax=Aegilops tauschii subsp. strangulata TaxID=200361 RepID=A0A452ZB02_AEGTS
MLCFGSDSLASCFCAVMVMYILMMCSGNAITCDFQDSVIVVLIIFTSLSLL